MNRIHVKKSADLLVLQPNPDHEEVDCFPRSVRCECGNNAHLKVMMFDGTKARKSSDSYGRIRARYVCECGKSIVYRAGGYMDSMEIHFQGDSTTVEPDGTVIENKTIVQKVSEIRRCRNCAWAKRNQYGLQCLIYIPKYGDYSGGVEDHSVCDEWKERAE